MYTPPFTVTPKAVNLMADIYSQIERYAIRLEQEDALRLRKINRMKTIHSSLAIEGNVLTESQVLEIMEGKTVVAPPREIQEVKNAIRAYDLYASLNPFSMQDLLRTHGVMMQGVIDDAGHFRRTGVGVFEGTHCVHLAPPADRVPALVQDLLEWAEKAEDNLLIRSCVFHYEFEFIHPFTDGNGRMGRMWQSLMLGKVSPVFQYLPVENMVYANQTAYYDAIAESTRRTDSAPMIEFMLGEILATLKARQGTIIEKQDVGINVGTNVGINTPAQLTGKEQTVVSLLSRSPRMSAAALAVQLGVTSRQCERILHTLRERGILTRVGANKSGHWKITIPHTNS